MLRPVGCRVIVKPVASEAKTTSGILLPESAKKKIYEGTVIAAGPGKMTAHGLVPPGAEVGDTVIYTQYGGINVTVDDVDYLILDDDGILAIRDKESA